MESEVPLVIPEINGSLLRDFQGRIIATPSCSTTPIALCLKPLDDKFGIKRVVVSTYQSVSGEGSAAYEELSSQTVSLLNGQSVEPSAFSHQIAFNCLPKIGGISGNGSTEEEERIERELRKILDLPELKVCVTAVRVPTFCGHGASVNVEFQGQMESVEEVRELLDVFPASRSWINPRQRYIPPILNASEATILSWVGSGVIARSPRELFLGGDGQPSERRCPQCFGNSRNPLQLPHHELSGFRLD